MECVVPVASGAAERDVLRDPSTDTPVKFRNPLVDVPPESMLGESEPFCEVAVRVAVAAESTPCRGGGETEAGVRCVAEGVQTEIGAVAGNDLDVAAAVVDGLQMFAARNQSAALEGGVEFAQRVGFAGAGIDRAQIDHLAADGDLDVLRGAGCCPARPR